MRHCAAPCAWQGMLSLSRPGMQGNGGGIGSGGTFAPDRTNNVEQVAVPNLPPGDVSIEVGCSLHSAQTSALSEGMTASAWKPQ